MNQSSLPHAFTSSAPSAGLAAPPEFVPMTTGASGDRRDDDHDRQRRHEQDDFSG
jgi:hypothetical protein